MPAIQRHTKDLADGWVKAALHFVEPGGDDGEAEEEGRVDVVEEAVGGTPAVGEEGVCARGVDGQRFPSGVEGGGRVAVVCRRGRVVVGEGDLRHGG